MQTLDISNSTPRTENRLKTLFWPSIETGADVDYLGAQGYWVCSVAALISFAMLAMTGHPVMGALILLFYYLGGVGVREHSLYAAAVVLMLYIGDTVAAGPGVVRILIGALLLSNLRATWIAANWRPESDDAVLPPRFAETWSDKFADQLPMWLWPKVRIVYYIFSACFLIIVALGMVAIMLRRPA
jgi:hypothetical protein